MLNRDKLTNAEKLEIAVDYLEKMLDVFNETCDCDICEPCKLALEVESFIHNEV